MDHYWFIVLRWAEVCIFVFVIGFSLIVIFEAEWYTWAKMPGAYLFLLMGFCASIIGLFAMAREVIIYSKD